MTREPGGPFAQLTIEKSFKNVHKLRYARWVGGGGWGLRYGDLCYGGSGEEEGGQSKLRYVDMDASLSKDRSVAIFF